MIGPSNFHVEIGYDDVGLLVTMFHRPTNQKRSGRQVNGETCAKLQDRLWTGLLNTFFSLNDFRFSIGRCVVDGRIGDSYYVEHLPSGRNKSLDTLSSPDSRNPQQTLLESLLLDLWQDHVLGLRTDDS